MTADARGCCGKQVNPKATFQPQQNSVGGFVCCVECKYLEVRVQLHLSVFVLYIPVMCMRLSKGSVQFRQIIQAETLYGLNVLWLKSRLGHSFPHPSRPALGLNHSPVQLLLDIFAGGEVTEA